MSTSVGNIQIEKTNKEWNKFEIWWFIISFVITLGVCVYAQSPWLSTLSSLAGIVSVVLCAKGKISYLYFGIFQCVTYGYIAIVDYQLLGEGMLNLGIFLPFNILTFFLWKKNLKDKENVVNGEEVKTRKMTKNNWIIAIPILIVSTFLYAILLNMLDARQFKLDSLAVVLSLFAQVLLTFRFVENWLIWIAVNAITVVLWILTFMETGGNDYGFLIMQAAFLVNSIYAYINWLKISKS